MIARQGGKNELSARIEAHLLTAFAQVGGAAIKAAPTFDPQVNISISRLQQVLDRACLAPYYSKHGRTFRSFTAPASYFSAPIPPVTSSATPPTHYWR